jgi:hypothetical protein
MQSVNELGFYWRNEQHRFQSVWMVSLIAVFGMSLFSCQNTLSKEVVAKMEQDAHEILQDSSIVESSEKDSVADTPPWENIADNPLNNIISSGGTCLPIHDWEITTECVLGVEWAFMGDFYVEMGMIGPSTGTKEEDSAQLALSRMMFPENGLSSPSPSGENISPWPHRNNMGKRADLVFDTETDDFIAYITPAPIELESKLIIEAYGNHEIYMTLENVTTGHYHTDKKIDVTTGVQAYTLGLDKLPKADYQLELNSWRTSQTIQFHWKGLCQD